MSPRPDVIRDYTGTRTRYERTLKILPLLKYAQKAYTHCFSKPARARRAGGRNAIGRPINFKKGLI